MDKIGQELIEKLITDGYLKTPEIIGAFKKIDRIDFLPEHLRSQAYSNEALPIGGGQTISQPLTVAFMLELLQPQKGNTVLEIGGGSGWLTTLIADVIGEKGKIYVFERISELCEFGIKNIQKYFSNLDRVVWICGNGQNGLAQNAPFDRIIVSAAVIEVPAELKKQLAVGGRMVIPIGRSIWLFIKESEDKFAIEKHHGFAFVPFIQDKQ